MKRNRTKSAALFEAAKTYFPGGVNSPVRAFKSVYGPPLFIKKGDGCRIWDEDDYEYIDFCCSWGPLIHGHNHPKVRRAIMETVENGTSFGAPTKLGNALGKLILDNHRFIEKIRFVSSGTEAVMSAVRLARGATGRSKIIKFEGCYHGHVDSLMVKAGSGLVTFGVSTSAGIPESTAKETIVLPLDDEAAVERIMKSHGNEIACIVIEPIPANNGLLLQRPEYLRFLKEISSQYGALLVFDEVISGFRTGFEGASGYYGVEADIYTFGKIIGGGMPVGAYAGSKTLMNWIAPEGPVYQAGTLSANPVAMAAGHAALELLLAEGYYQSLEEKTNWFVEEIVNYCQEKGFEMRIQHCGSIFWIAFTDKVITKADQIDPESMGKFKVLHRELLDRGVYLGPSGYEVGFISSAHERKDLELTIESMKAALDIVFS